MSISFACHIGHLFRPRDVRVMKVIAGFDLSKYEDVRANAEAIHRKLEDGSMPCDGAWPKEHVELFKTWIESGFPA